MLLYFGTKSINGFILCWTYQTFRTVQNLRGWFFLFSEVVFFCHHLRWTNADEVDLVSEFLQSNLCSHLANAENIYSCRNQWIFPQHHRARAHHSACLKSPTYDVGRMTARQIFAQFGACANVTWRRFCSGYRSCTDRAVVLGNNIYIVRCLFKKSKLKGCFYLEELRFHWELISSLLPFALSS